jgi:hypothetical protein
MSDLRAIAREAILAGKFPRRRPQRASAWQGMGACCAICGTQVRQHEIEFELEFAPDEDDPHAGSYRVHSACFEAWELERHGVEAAADVPTANGQPRPINGFGLNGGGHGGDLSAQEQDVTMTTREREPKYGGNGA